MPVPRRTRLVTAAQFLEAPGRRLAPRLREDRPGRREGLRAGDVLPLLPDAIHSVRNDTAAVTVSLHVYGYNLNMSGRLQFAPERDGVESVALKLER